MVGELVHATPSPLNSAPEASIVIPAHNAATTLGRQLDALARQHNAPKFEVIVVANRCTDDTAAIASRFESQLDLTVIVADNHASAAYARNRGAARARASLLLFCDADDEVGCTWVSEMVEPLRSGHADFVGGVIHVDRHNLRDWIYTWRFQGIDGRAVMGSPGELPYALSASLGVTTAVFAAIGGFDERFGGAASEEVDLQNRLLRAGHRIGAATGAHLTYTPRRSIPDNLAHARSYFRGQLTLQAKEGCFERQPLAAGLRQTLRVIGYRIIRQHDVHPGLLYAVARENLDRAILHSRVQPGGEPCSQDASHDFAAPVGTPTIGGLAFTAVRKSEAVWYEEHGIEHDALRHLEQLLPPGGTFVDVGANIGILSVAAAQLVGPQGRVIAFEPDKRARSNLASNVERHHVDNIVTIHAEAVGASSGRLEFRRYENSLVSGFGVAPSQFSPGPLLDQTTVNVVTLDDTVTGPVDVVKIDVEGFEADVIAGARNLIRSNPNISIIFEINPTSLAAAERNIDELLDFFPHPEWDLRLVDDTTLDDASEMTSTATRADLRTVISQQPPGWFSSIVATRPKHAMPQRVEQEHPRHPSG